MTASLTMPAVRLAAVGRRRRSARVLLALLLGLAGPAAEACTVCRPRVQAAIHDAHYTANLLLLLLPVALLLLLGAALYYADDLQQRFARPHA